jgi:CRP-like cAMP-binding protein
MCLIEGGSMNSSQMPESDDALREIFLFKDLPEADLEKIRSLVNPLRYREDWTLFEEGEEGKHLYLIRSGSVKLVHQFEGKSSILAILFPGDSFGELSLIDGETRSASAITLEPCEFLVINRTPFMELLADNPLISHAIMVKLCQRLRGNIDRLDELHHLGASSRMYKSIRDLAEENGEEMEGEVCINLHMSLTELGKLNGLSEKMAEVTLKQMEAKGLIKIEGQTVCLLK